jgi:hypothetical protein
MQKLVAAGQIYDRLIGVGGVSSSADGYLWSAAESIVTPFPPLHRAQDIATDGTNFIVVSDNGMVANSTDTLTWRPSTLLGANFSPRAVNWGANGGSRACFCMAGVRKYDPDTSIEEEYVPLEEVGEILVAESTDPTQWLTAFTHPFPNSFFHGVRYLEGVTVDGVTTTVWVAMGEVDGRASIWFTVNINWLIENNVPDLYTWREVVVPEEFQDRAMFDAVAYDGTIYFSGRGIVLATSDLGSPVWIYSKLFTNNGAKVDLVRISVNPDGILAAASSSLLITSPDRVGWNRYSSPGYSFCSIHWFLNHWIAGSFSNLTAHTYFTSMDGINWTPRNNHLQMYGLCSY